MAGVTKVSSALTPKRKKFVREFVKDQDATRAYRAAYDAKNMLPNTVHREAYETTRNPLVNSEIQRLLADNGIEVSDILGIHSRNMHQEEHLPTSQRAAESLAEMIGLKAQAKAPTVNVAFVVNGSTEPHTK